MSMKPVEMEQIILSKSFEGFPVDMEMKYMKSVLPPGDYWIGDITKVLDFPYVRIWDNHGFANGEYDMGNSKKFAVHSTYSGDGNFISNLDRIFIVDGGVIGIVEMSLMEDSAILNESEDLYYIQCGMIRVFKEEVTFVYFNGTFLISSGDFFLRIYTNLNANLYMNIVSNEDEEEEEEIENSDLDEARFISEKSLEEIFLEEISLE